MAADTPNREGLSLASGRYHIKQRYNALEYSHRDFDGFLRELLRFLRRDAAPDPAGARRGRADRP